MGSLLKTVISISCGLALVLFYVVSQRQSMHNEQQKFEAQFQEESAEFDAGMEHNPVMRKKYQQRAAAAEKEVVRLDNLTRADDAASAEFTTKFKKGIENSQVNGPAVPSGAHK